MRKSDLHTAWEIIRDSDPSGWFVGGGCYDFAHGLGTLLESLGVPVTYWEYGSDDEPLVHVALEIETEDSTVYLDGGSFTTSLEGILETGDFYAETELQWKIIAKEAIPWDEDLEERFERLIVGS